ncbi:hypothetical protein AX17_005663 [Amanita inopinata Kibby_2008]|nr:hypothetical protein AX17_005663 [Amanita inopinata Kibby_2008]
MSDMALEGESNLTVFEEKRYPHLDSQDAVSDTEEEFDAGKARGQRTKPSKPRSTAGYRRAAAILSVFAILLGFVLTTYQTTRTQKPKVIYANRYSKEHKFRPAASPIITETLKDGRVRVRGAEPTKTSVPKPTNTVKRKRKRSGKGKRKPRV